jgi:hypothetical protein
MEAQPDYPIETFDPLLRDLMCWGLVIRQEGAPDAPWQLVPAAQQRLAELQPTSPPHAAAIVYLDHRCADCRQRGPTRMHEECYLCERCRAERQGQFTTAVTEPTSDRHTHFWRRSRSSETTVA